METTAKLPRFKNLGPKIKYVREKVLKRVLGRKITQSEFCKFFPLDEEAGITLQRSTVARWEATEDHIRTDPQRKYLRILADITDDPTHYYSWFLDDEISVDDYVTYTADGNRDHFMSKSELAQESEYWDKKASERQGEHEQQTAVGLLAQAFKEDSSALVLREKFKASYLAYVTKNKGLGALNEIQKQRQNQLLESEDHKFRSKMQDFWPAIKHQMRKKSQKIDGTFDANQKIGENLAVPLHYYDIFNAISLVSASRTLSPEALTKKVMECVGRLTTVEMVSGPTNKLLILVTQDSDPLRNMRLMEMVVSLNGCARLRAVATTPDHEVDTADFILQFLQCSGDQDRIEQLPLVIPTPS